MMIKDFNFSIFIENDENSNKEIKNIGLMTTYNLDSSREEPVFGSSTVNDPDYSINRIINFFFWNNEEPSLIFEFESDEVNLFNTTAKIEFFNEDNHEKILIVDSALSRVDKNTESTKVSYWIINKNINPNSNLMNLFNFMVKNIHKTINIRCKITI